MDTWYYLSLIPEALVASMLPPKEFGSYLSTGTQKRPHGQAMFFSLKKEALGDAFDLAAAAKRIVPHPDGQPKRSLYLSIYRVLERVPLEAIGSLHLATAHGRVLELKPAEQLPAEPKGRYHLYQELAPVHPLIASSLGPQSFCRLITDPSKPIHVPRLCFVEMDPGGLTEDPAGGSAGNLPYRDVTHLRESLAQLEPQGRKQTKTVDRLGVHMLIYRSVTGGFYVGDREKMMFFPYPTFEEMERNHYDWWRCANDSELEQPFF